MQSNLSLPAPKILNEDVSYNRFLFDKRKELKLSIRKFAKALGISKFRYRLIENGYIKPSKKDIKKISNYYRIYKEEIDNKKYNRFTNLIYHSFTKRKVRITFFILFIISLLTTLSLFIANASIAPNLASLQDSRVVELNDNIIEHGDNSFSAFKFSYPLISKNVDLEGGNQKAILIKSNYNKKYITLTFSQIYWYDDYRFSIKLGSYSPGLITFYVQAYNYDSLESSIYEFYDLGDEYLYFGDLVGATELENIFKTNDVYQDFTDLINEKTGLNYSFIEIAEAISQTKQKYTDVSTTLVIVSVVMLFFTAAFLFLFGYSSVYKKEKNTRYSFNRSDELLVLKPLNKGVRKDIRLFPFIPETALRIFGFLCVFVGSLRVVFYIMNMDAYSTENIAAANMLYSILMLGMFLVFYINFDIFMHDNRIFRNLMLYPMVFFFIYLAEAYFLSTIFTEESVLTVALKQISIPNPFASATCYFLIIAFLFVTPSYANTKKKLIIYRSMAIVPILIIIISFMLANSKFFFNFEFKNYWFKMLFIGDRFSLSILAITYLVSLFFLRLFFKKRFGERNANRFFMGNKYIFIKNTLAALLIIIIWAFEVAFSNNTTLNSMGIGSNTLLIFLAPLVFLYHPHKNARRVPLDVALIIIYGFILVLLYASASILGLASLAVG